MSATATAQVIPGWLAPLANPGFPGLPNLQVPVLGNKWAVGTVFLFHVFFGSYTMGTLVTGPTYELVGALRHSPRCLRYADTLGDANLYAYVDDNPVQKIDPFGTDAVQGPPHSPHGLGFKCKPGDACARFEQS